MPAVVTSSFRIANAKEFINSFEEAVNGGRSDIEGITYMYLFIGKALSWDKTHAGYSDTLIPTPDGDIQGNVYEPWNDMIAAERLIANSDISFGAKRYNWTAGDSYIAYDDQNPAITKGLASFYVYESGAGDVFKCLDNNGGVPSTVRPVRPNSDSIIHTPFTKVDGYRWKYMFTIPTGQAKFLTTNYIPVRTLNVHTELAGGLDGPPVGYNNQATIQERANNGSIETYVIISEGSGFTKHSGGLSEVQRKTIPNTAANTTFLRLSTSANPQQGFYNGASIYLSNTTYQKGVGIIKEYGTLTMSGGGTLTQAVLLYGTTVEGDGSFAAKFAPSSVAGSTPESYHIGPRLEVLGDGNNANAYAICTSGGSISQVNTWQAGNNYTTSNVVVVGEATASGQNIRGVLSPSGGHGFDPVSELNAYNVIVAKSLTGAGIGNSFPVTNEYRTIGLLRNPYLKEGYAGPGSGVIPTILATATSGKNWYANTLTIRQATWVTANTTEGPGNLKGSTVWTPAVDDEVIGSLSRVTARVIDYNSHSNGILILGNVSAANSSSTTFLNNEQIGKLQDIEGTSAEPSTTYVTANGHFVDGVGAAIVVTLTDALTPPTPIIYAPELQPQTGDILYLENRTPITRSIEQSEEIKIVVEF